MPGYAGRLSTLVLAVAQGVIIIGTRVSDCDALRLLWGKTIRHDMGHAKIGLPYNHDPCECLQNEYFVSQLLCMLIILI